MSAQTRVFLGNMAFVIKKMMGRKKTDRASRLRFWSALNDVGINSVFFIVITLGFVGTIMMLHGGYQAARIIGDSNLVGPQILPLMIRQLGPTLAGLMVATRVGTGMAARIGSMVVTEQVDALRLSNACPVNYLITPSWHAALVMVPILSIFGITAAFFSGMLTAYVVFETAPGVYADWSFVSGLDAVEALIKSISFGAVIPLIAGTCGLSTHGGSAGVGRATTNAVVLSSLAVIILDFFIGALILGLR
ncbi:MAG: ABC transporter permease [Myxococcales bacterium]|nr:ABC transporter permease [Myxococcales bacterium]